MPSVPCSTPNAPPTSPLTRPQYILTRPQYILTRPQYILTRPQYILTRPQYIKYLSPYANKTKVINCIKRPRSPRYLPHWRTLCKTLAPCSNPDVPVFNDAAKELIWHINSRELYSSCQVRAVPPIYTAVKRVTRETHRRPSSGKSRGKISYQRRLLWRLEGYYRLISTVRIPVPCLPVKQWFQCKDTAPDNPISVSSTPYSNTVTCVFGVG